ncbi:MAG: hypothetical protein AB2606_15355 [Candidatus Thiodiazotropha taylori]
MKRRRPEGVSAVNQSRPSAHTQAKETLLRAHFIGGERGFDSNPPFERNEVTQTPQRSESPGVKRRRTPQ